MKICVPPLHTWGHGAVVVLVLRHDIWVKLLLTSALWKLVWLLLIPRKPILREETFRSVPAQEPLDPVSEIYGVFSNGQLMLIVFFF